MPDLSSNFYDAQIKHLMIWISDTADPKLKGIYMELVQSLGLIKIKKKENAFMINNYCVTSTVKIWSRICKVMDINEHEMINLKEIPEFKPNAIDL